MGLSSSMWTSVSGLLAHGEKMNVISNNLANVSTIGFKSQRMDFEDFLYQEDFSGSGSTQIGFGVGINAVISDFSQGSFESTNSATDLAISGGGFFKVVNQATGSDYYTRAGNFNFNNQGFLTLPGGEVLQGWKVNSGSNPLPATGINPLVAEPQGIQTIGDAQDIVLDTWTVLPKATTKVEFSVNLTAEDDLDKSVATDSNPLFAMSEAWNGKHAIDNPGDPALSEDAYVYPAPITVYDEGGNKHQLTCYFDQVPTKKVDSATGETVDVIEGLPTGYSVYEYLLTMNPEEDARTYGGDYNPATGVLTGAESFQDTEAAGILMKGTMIFNSAGELVSQTAYSFMGSGEFDGVTTPLGIDPDEVIAAAKRAGDLAVANNKTTIDADALASVEAELGATRDAYAVATADTARVEAATAAAGGDRASVSKAVADQNAIDAATAAAVATGDIPGSTAYQAAYETELAAFTADGRYAAALTAAEAAWDGDYNTAFAAFDHAAAVTAAELEYENGNVWQNALTRATAEETAKYYDVAYNDEYNNGTLYGLTIDMTYGHPDSALSWQPTPVSDSGYPVFTANFSGHPMGNAVGQTKIDGDTTNSKDAQDILIEFDLGLQSENPVSPWAMGGVVGIAPTGTTSIADLMTNLAGGTATSISYDNLAALVPTDRAAGSSTSLGDASSINFSSQNGYTSGNLTNARIDADGVLYGIYSNGVEMPLYQVAMYDFVNPQGLYREGGNLYSETPESGSIQQAQAGIAGMGSINAYNIEQSNVDMSREFVQMIVTQRGFQGNSKGITTVDTMLEQVINMKR